MNGKIEKEQLSPDFKAEIDGFGTSLSERVNVSEVVTTPTANKLLKLNSNSKLPASITGDADSVDGIQGNQIPLKTTTDINYYIDATNGLDTNNGLTSGTAFKTIQKAINMLPMIINHAVNINVASGTYNERVVVQNFIGNGYINIIGGSTINTSYNVDSLAVSTVLLMLTIKGLNFTNTTNDDSILTDHCSKLLVDSCNLISNSTTKNGIRCLNTVARIGNSCISNKNNAIIASNQSIIFSTGNSGSNNTVGLSCLNASKIGKFITQPSGTTAETTVAGGVIN